MDSGPSDEMLILAVAGRDMGAFRVLYERHAGWLAVRLARRCNDGDLVADAVQDTFVAVWRKPGGFRGDGDIATWVSPLRAAIAVSLAWLAAIWLLAARSGSPDAVLQGPARAGFLALAAASFSVFLVRRRRLAQLRPWR